MDANDMNADIQRLVDEAARSMDGEIVKKCETEVRRQFCHGQFCEKFDECDVAQHDLQMMRLIVWRVYARKN